MRILHVIAGAPTGGAETFAQDVITAFAEQGHEQHAICRPHPLMLRTCTEASVAVTPMTFSPLSRLTGAPRRIARFAEEWRADIVHAWMSRAASFIPDRRGRDAMPCPVVGWLGGYYAPKYFRNADALIGVTPDIRRHIVDGGVPTHRAFLCHTFGTLRDAPPVDRAGLDTPDDALVLLVLSRLHRKKGIDTAIRAMQRLPAAYLWLAGDGPQAGEYRRLAKQLGVADRVRFLGWRTDRKALLEAADICLLPSRYEPFGTVIAEAWSARRPLVTTPADGARQFVRHEVEGLVFPIDDAGALAACVSRIAADSRLAERLVDGGHRAYERQFSRSIVVDRLLSIYERVIALGSTGSEFVDIDELGGAADALAAKLGSTVQPELRRRLVGAAATALAYCNDEAGRDLSMAIDAGLLELTGARQLYDRSLGGRRVRVLGPRDFDGDITAIDMVALRSANTAFVDALAGQLERPSW